MLKGLGGSKLKINAIVIAGRGGYKINTLVKMEHDAFLAGAQIVPR
jgi:tRNA A22 N-methylase